MTFPQSPSPAAEGVAPLPPAPLPPSGLVADARLDASGLRCPLPLLRAKLALRDLAPGLVLEVTATDAGSVNDFAAYARLSGQPLLAFSEADGTYHYWFRKAGGHSTGDGTGEGAQV